MLDLTSTSKNKLFSSKITHKTFSYTCSMLLDVLEDIMDLKIKLLFKESEYGKIILDEITNKVESFWDSAFPKLFNIMTMKSDLLTYNNTQNNYFSLLSSTRHLRKLLPRLSRTQFFLNQAVFNLKSGVTF